MDISLLLKMSKNRYQTKSEIEEDVLRAINMVETGNCNARQAAEICQTSFCKVRSRLRGHKPKHERKGANTLLFEEEEKALCLWIGYLQDIFLYASLQTQNVFFAIKVEKGGEKQGFEPYLI